MTEVDTCKGPSYWASYIVNGDGSGMREDELAKCDAWLEYHNARGWRVVSCEDDSDFSDCYIFGLGRFAGDVCTYILHGSNEV
jgi:hypothetical protein